MLDKDIVKYIENNIFKRYDEIDQAHNRSHIINVIENSLEIAKDYNVDINMIYIIAAYHDIGLLYNRDRHHIISGKILMEDNFINKRYKNKDLIIMKQAIEDHRASSLHMPRSIYGKILAEADRDLDYDRIIKRSIDYTRDKNPDYNREDIYNNVYNHLKDKYGREGYITLPLGNKKSLDRLEYLRQRIEDRTIKKDIILKLKDYNISNGNPYENI